jgi:hypothetical protein
MNSIKKNTQEEQAFDPDAVTKHGTWVLERAGEFIRRLDAGETYDEVRHWWENEPHTSTEVCDVLVEVRSQGKGDVKKISV